MGTFRYFTYKYPRLVLKYFKNVFVLILRGRLVIFVFRNALLRIESLKYSVHVTGLEITWDVVLDELK